MTADLASPPRAPTGVFEAFAVRGKTAWWRYVATFALGFCLWFVVLVALTLANARFGWLPGNITAELTTPTDPVPFYLSTGVLFATLTAALALASRWILKKRLTDVVGLWRWRLFGAGVLIWTAVLILSTLADYLIQPGGFSLTASARTWTLVWVALAGLGAQTFAEEWIFRGWLTQGLFLATGRRALPAAVLSGLLFGAAHIPNGGPQALSAVIFGIAAALIAIRTGGIAVTYGLHLVNNLFGAVVVVSASDVLRGSPGLISQHTRGLDWWDVAVEAAGVIVVALLLARRGQAGATEPLPPSAA